MLATPFSVDGSVDELGFRRILDHNLACGVRGGVMFPGFASEFKQARRRRVSPARGSRARRRAGRSVDDAGALPLDWATRQRTHRQLCARSRHRAVVANDLTAAGIDDPNLEGQTVTPLRALAELNRICALTSPPDSGDGGVALGG